MPAETPSRLPEETRCSDPKLQQIVDKFRQEFPDNKQNYSKTDKTRGLRILTEAYLWHSEKAASGQVCKPQDAMHIMNMASKLAAAEDQGNLHDFATMLEGKVAPSAVMFYINKLKEAVKKPVLNNTEQVEVMMDIDSLYIRFTSGGDANVGKWILYFADKFIAKPNFLGRRKTELGNYKSFTQERLNRIER